jgi:large subunit ribosomal protein L6
MSKIGGKPIAIPEGVTVTKEHGGFSIKGKLGTLTVKLLPNVKGEIAEGKIVLTIDADNKQTHANWGTTGAHLKNAVKGVTEGFKKSLDVQGIGYKANMEGKTLVLNLGFTHPIKFPTPEGMVITVEKNLIHVSGMSREVVGQTSATIRSYKKPEPYLGKGIRYVGERVRRKAGKKVAGTTAGA